MRLRRSIGRLFGMALSLSFLHAMAVPIVQAQDLAFAPGANAPTPNTTTVVRVHVNDVDHLNRVAGRLDIWEAHLDELYVVAAITPTQYEWLDGLGYRLEVDGGRTASVSALAALDPRYHYFDNFYTNANGLYVVDFLQDINAAYPDLTELIDIGDGWMADAPGEHHRDILVLRITNEDPAYGPIGDKPVFFLFGTIHAREVAIPELAIRYIKYLTEGFGGEGGYGVDPDVTWMVNHSVAHVLVMQNPDGHWANEQSTAAFRRKNMDWDDGCVSPTNWGVDLNRNHSFFWGCCNGSSGSPCEVTYRGPTPASEPETQAFQYYFASVMVDQNGPSDDNTLPPAAPDDTTGIFISLHSYSDLILWPWSFFDHGPSPNDGQLRTIARKFAYYSRYNPTGDINYNIDGSTDDWTYGRFGVASFTFEVGPGAGACGGFFPAYGCIDGIDGMTRNFWAENKPALLYAHKIARTPYITAYGPDAGPVRALPNVVRAGAAVTLAATVADNRVIGDTLQPIAAAEYFIDEAGTDGTGSAMSPSDGAWNETNELPTASLDTSGLEAGRHYLLVHGRSFTGQWGPFTAAFLDICYSTDFDCDADVDLVDYSTLRACLAGPGVVTPPPGCTADEFTASDLDDDLDVDFADVASFRLLFGQ